MKKNLSNRDNRFCIKNTHMMIEKIQAHTEKTILF